MNCNDIFVHDVGNPGLITFDQEQILQCQDSQKLPVFRYITGIYRLFVDSRTPDAGQRFIDRHIRTKGDVLRRHDRAGAVFGIAQNFIDFPAHLRICLCQNPLYYIGRHLLYEVNSVVNIQLVNHFPQLAVGKTLDQQLLQIRIHFHKRLGG